MDKNEVVRSLGINQIKKIIWNQIIDAGTVTFIAALTLSRNMRP